MLEAVENTSKENNDPPSRKYLIDSDNPSLALIHAARIGDNQIINVLYDPMPISELENQTQIKLFLYNQKKEQLIRKYKIKKTQIRVLETAYKIVREDIIENSRTLKALIKPQLYHRLVEFATNKRLIENIDEITARINFELFNLLVEFRKEHRAKLSKTYETFIDDETTKTHKRVELNLKLRIKLHIKFSEQLENEFRLTQITLDNLNLAKGKKLHQTLRSAAEKIVSDVNALDQSHQSLILENEVFIADRKKTYDKHDSVKHPILHNIFRTEPSIRVLNFEVQKKFFVLGLSRTDINSVIEESTGNNLLHIALENGHFGTAKLLIELKINYKHLNYSHIAAIETQDKNGDTYIHHLAREGNFDTICDLILQGIRYDFANKKLETLTTLMSQTGTIIHFLFEKLRSENYNQKYLDCLLKLLSDNLLLKTFSITNKNGVTALQIILKLTASNNSVIKKIKMHVESISFPNKFQNKINMVLWNHFFHLLSEKQKFFCFYFDTQMEFLIELQSKLIEASIKKSNMELVAYLTQKVKSGHTLNTDFRETYALYLKYLKELEKKQTRDLSNDEKKFFYTDSDKTTKPSSVSFQMVTKTLSQGKKIEDSIQTKPTEATKNNPIIAHPSPLKNQAKAKPKNPDYFHWFDGHSAKKSTTFTKSKK